MCHSRMNFLKKKLKGKSSAGGPGQRLDSDSSNASPGRHAPSDAKDAAKLAAEKRLAADLEKKAQEDQRRRDRQMKIEEDRYLQQQMREMSIQEQQDYQKKIQAEQQPAASEPVKKKFNPVLYTSSLVNEGLIAGPASEIFQQLADIIKTSQVDDEEKRSLAARLFQTANTADVKEKAMTRIRKMVQMICENPDEKKYREVKRQHPLYAETVLPAIGAELFILLIGFEIAEVPEKGQVVRLKEGIELDLLPFYVELLESQTNPLELHIYRHPKMYFLAENAKMEPIKMPDWSYKVTGAEMAALQKEREREVEWWFTVCSKKPKSVPTPFKVSIIRIRFPNSAILEALFSVDESVSDVVNYVAELLDYPPESFVLNEAVGNKFDVNSAESIGELKLVPFAMLHFKFIDAAKRNLPGKEHTKMCQDARQKMDFVGVDIADYRF